MRSYRLVYRAGAAAFASLLATAAPARAQLITDQHVRVNVSAGFETEQYLRALQLAGVAPQYPWSVRAFGADELEYLMPAADSMHPWSTRVRRATGKLQWYLLAPSAQLLYNTTLPYGANDGPLWAGRGLTSDLQFGFGASAGPVSLVVAPEVFRAENRGFPLVPTGGTGARAFANGYVPGAIDAPQRFGDLAYQRFDLGQTTLRIAPGPVAIGISTANEYWGPAVFNPVLLGNNAGGFPHVFAGTSHPLDLWLFKVHGRVIWGRLDQSDYSPYAGSEKRRLGDGLVGIIEPRGLPGLELGASRFYHKVWPEGGPKWSDISMPFTLNSFAASRRNTAGTEKANQIASIFFRWAFPGTGFEAYGEFGREDYNNDIIDVISEPDHISAYTVGVQRVLRRSAQNMLVLKGEVMNSRTTRLERVRAQGPFYVHTPVTQGHTERGQVLGAPAGLGGGGTNLSVDSYSPSGRWSVRLTRQMVDQSRQSAFYGVTGERLWFRRYADLRVAVTQAVEINRNPEQDVGNLNLQIGTLIHW